MKNIIYECGLPNTLSGGFGDRLMGIASCISLSEKYNCKFLIKWDDFRLDNYFDFDNSNYYKHEKLEGKTIKIVNHSVKELKEILNKKETFDCENLIFNTNQNIWQFLNEYQNVECYEDYTNNLFKTVFEKYLKPNNILETKINNITNEKKLIGIQLRFGDVLMNEENGQINNPQRDHFPLGTNITNIRNLLINLIMNHQQNVIFITSDINLNKIINVKNINNLIYLDEPPVHIERTNNKKYQNMEKCFLDFLILCKCEKLYITFESNFGRIPGIIIKDNVYAINGNLEINNISVNELSCKRY